MLTAVVNVTENWGIGLKGRLIVSIPEDLKRFRELTTRNIILSDDPDFAPEGAEVVRSIPELDELIRDERGEVVVIGGASVYEQLFDRCAVIYVTRTYGDYPADRFFPDLDALPNWRMGDVSPVYDHDGTKFRYINYYNTDI